MKRSYLLDTGPAYDFLFQRAGIRERMYALQRTGAKFGIGLPTLGEIIAGLEGSTSRKESWVIVHRSLGRLIRWPFDDPAAYEYGRLFADLRKRGRVIQQVDIQLAAITLTKKECVLVTYDSDFSVITGLPFENWLA
ncbi:type II toxin-antitoxin system VapC family toxin [Zavarzinella formosa]|uniref:type II toxin-antitoxin system VapC family toxin n=1 Tax=Zavarzinella formosa TaxID=360055 RepID=UPI0002FFB43F|nr:type II toxin-antitoxin system VapC family toxin [Zavarzinella formosa]